MKLSVELKTAMDSYNTYDRDSIFIEVDDDCPNITIKIDSRVLEVTRSEFEKVVRLLSRSDF
jgi:hypothetical protein